MLTPQEISGKEFVKAVFGGYDMSAVDDFLESLTADYSLLYKENAILKSKIKVLVEKVEEYRSTEDAMRMALLTAQKMGDDLLSDARKKSDAIIEEAKAAADMRLAETDRLMLEEKNRLSAAREATSAFVAESQEIIARHSEFLANLDSISLKEEEPAPVPAPTREDEIVDAAREIDSAVSKLVEEELPAPAAEPAQEAAPAAEPAPAAESAAVPDEPEYDDESEPTKVFPFKAGDLRWPEGDDDDSPSPKPKFDFNNLKFGKNYTDDDDDI